MASAISQENDPASTRAAPSTSVPVDHSSLSSEPFKIIAQSGKQFFVHSDILAAQSEPLRSTTTGIWREATERKIDLSDWDGDTVGRFVGFFYSGTYEVPESTIDEGEDENRARIGGWDTPCIVQILMGQEVRIEDRNVLLAHAKVYALAQYKDVQVLKMMALERLKTALGSIKETSKGVAANIIGLLLYVYSNTDSLTSSNEPMRDLVSRFMADNLETWLLMDRGKMDLLLHEGGDFAVELMEKVVKRLGEMDRKLLETGIHLSESRTGFVEVTRNLGVTERELQSSRDHATELHQKLRQLKIANAEGAREAFQLKKMILDARRLLEHRRLKTQPALPILKQALSLYGPFLTVAISAVVAILVTLLIQQTLQPKTIDGNYFESICQYYEVRSWAESTFIMVGRKSLMEACAKHKPGSRVQQLSIIAGGIEYKPGSKFQRPSKITGGTTKDICRFFQASSWVESAFWSIGGKPLKGECIKNYLTEKPSFKGKSLSEMCQYYEEHSWAGSEVYGVEGKSLKQYCYDAGFTKKPPSKKSTSTKTSPSMKKETSSAVDSGMFGFQLLSFIFFIISLYLAVYLSRVDASASANQVPRGRDPRQFSLK